MTHSRDQINLERLESSKNSPKPHRSPTVDNFIFLEHKPPDLPKRSQSINKYIVYPSKAGEENKSSHKTEKAYKLKEAGKEKEDRALYYIKYTSSSTPIAALEVFCYFMANFLGGPDRVPTAHILYDENNNYEICGLVSKCLPNFKTLREETLEEKDLELEIIDKFTEQEIEGYRAVLKNEIENLIKHLERTPADNGYFNYGIQYARNFCNQFRFAATAAKLKNELLYFSDPKVKLNLEKLVGLLTSLKERQRYILEELQKKKDYSLELESLKNFIAVTEKLLITVPKQTLNIVPKLEEINKIILKKEQENTIKFDTLNPEFEFTEEVFGEAFTIKAKDIKNYRIQKGLARGNAVRFIMEDTDGHRGNNSKKGELIDFDMAKLRILFRFREYNYFDVCLRKPNELTFFVSEYDLAHFPNIRDASFYYWVTQQTPVPPLLDKLPPVNRIMENFYTYKDNLAFKKLEKLPVNIFFTFTEFLKYILTDVSMYEEMWTLHLNEAYLKSIKLDANLLAEFKKNENERIAQFRKALIHIPEFRDFLNDHGSYSLKFILDEIAEFKNKFLSKMKDKSDGKNTDKKISDQPTFLKNSCDKNFYLPLCNTLDTEKILRRYEAIRRDCGLEPANPAMCDTAKNPLLKTRSQLFK